MAPWRDGKCFESIECGKRRNDFVRIKMNPRPFFTGILVRAPYEDYNGPKLKWLRGSMRKREGAEKFGMCKAESRMTSDETSIGRSRQRASTEA